MYKRVTLSLLTFTCRVGSSIIVQLGYVRTARAASCRHLYLLLGRRGLLVHIHSLIVTHIILTTITRMRPFYNIILPRSRLRSYKALSA